MEELKRKLLSIEPFSTVELKICVEGGTEKPTEKTFRGIYKLYNEKKDSWSPSDYVRLIDPIEIVSNTKGIKPLFVSVSNILQGIFIKDTNVYHTPQILLS